MSLGPGERAATTISESVSIFALICRLADNRLALWPADAGTLTEFVGLTSRSPTRDAWLGAGAGAELVKLAWDAEFEPLKINGGTDDSAFLPEMINGATEEV